MSECFCPEPMIKGDGNCDKCGGTNPKEVKVSKSKVKKK